MAVFDLKPLAAETIKDLKLKSDQLWEIKIDGVFYGPFETKQLRDYANENKKTLLRAHVSQMSIDHWKPFYEVREFIHEVAYDGPYWMLVNGRKSSPLSIEEIAKRIELGTIKRHDEISEDDGRHWHRISTHPVFEAGFTTGNVLPKSPDESSFQKSKVKVLEQLEHRAEIIDEKESVAGLTHVSIARKEGTRPVPVAEIKLVVEKPQSESFWAAHQKHFYWATPLVAIALYFSFSGSSKQATPEIADAEEKSGPQRSSNRANKKDRWSRTPANDSGDYDYNRSGVTQSPPGDDNYPTVIETHQEDNYPDPSAEADQVAEIQDQENQNAENPSLVQPVRDPAQEGESLDATMNNEAQEPNPAVDQPVVEEVSDF